MSSIYLFHYLMLSYYIHPFVPISISFCAPTCAGARRRAPGQIPKVGQGKIQVLHGAKRRAAAGLAREARPARARRGNLARAGARREIHKFSAARSAAPRKDTGCMEIKLCVCTAKFITGGPSIAGKPFW